MRTFPLSTLRTMAKQRANMENSDFIGSTEWNRMLSSMFGRMHGELAAVGMRLFETEQAITTVASTYASGTITCVAKASLVDGETFTLHDGYGPLVFEFDVDGSGVLVASNQRINVLTDTTAEEVETRAITAINAATHLDGTAIKITAANGGSGIIALTNDVSGSVGNQLIAESVASTSFVATNMTGGGGSYLIPRDHLSTVSVSYVVSATSGQIRPLRELMAPERHLFSASSGGEAVAYEFIDQYIHLWPIPPVGQTYRHRYIRQPVDLSAAPDATVVDVVTPDGEEFILWGAAVMALAKEESDTQVAMIERDSALDRLKWWAIDRSINTPRHRVVLDDDDYDFNPADYRWNRP